VLANMASAKIVGENKQGDNLSIKEIVDENK